MFCAYAMHVWHELRPAAAPDLGSVCGCRCALVYFRKSPCRYSSRDHSLREYLQHCITWGATGRSWCGPPLLLAILSGGDIVLRQQGCLRRAGRDEQPFERDCSLQGRGRSRPHELSAYRKGRSAEHFDGLASGLQRGGSNRTTCRCANSRVSSGRSSGSRDSLGTGALLDRHAAARWGRSQSEW